MATLETLKAELESLHTQREIAQAQLDLRQINQAAENGRLVLEAYGEMIDPREYLYDDPQFGYYTSPVSRSDDRKGGQFRPVFESETDLAMIRGAAHVMTTSFGSAWNILENLTNYTIAEGFEHEITSEEYPELAAVAQEVLKTFFDDNDWQSDFERELHWRTREDGEAGLLLRPRGWRAAASFIEPDWITQPAVSVELEEWLTHYGGEYAGDFVHCWSFGVHCRAADVSRALGYHVVYDGAGSDWEYFPADDVALARKLGTGVLELVKRNVPRNVKRGVSDFYPVLKRLERAEKLSTNVETTSAIQAAIAFIREHAPTATSAQITSLASGSATQTYQKPLPDGSTRSTRRRKFEPGEIIDTNGSKYLYGPMGQNNAPNFVEVVQAALRWGGTRWTMPEYMITGDGSNANLASTLVQGAPFVKAREADQRFYASRFHRIDWKVLRIAYEGNRFAQFGMQWEEIEAALTIKVTPPDITIANELEQSQIKTAEHAAGVLSTKTWIKESGRDVEEETANLEEEKAQKQAEFEQQQQQMAALGGGPIPTVGMTQGGSGSRFGARPFAETLLEDCGANAPGGGGFQPGNECAKGGGLGSSGKAKKPHNPQTQTAAFKKWFGDSKVVDENGEPLVVYHGTASDDEFTEFESNYRKGEQLGFGIHFAENAELANEYASPDGTARRGKIYKVMATYLAINNPLHADQIVKEGSPEFALAKKLAGSRLMTQTDEDGKKVAYLQAAVDSTGGKRAEKLIREAGYDGLRYKAKIITPGIGGYTKGKESYSWIAFSPTQIKSATGNSGAFNPKSANITETAIEDAGRRLAHRLLGSEYP